MQVSNISRSENSDFSNVKISNLKKINSSSPSATNVPEINKHRRKRCSSKICSLSSDVPGSVALSRHLLWSNAWAPPPWFYFLGIRKDRREAWSPSGKPNNLSNPSSSLARSDASFATAISSRLEICDSNIRKLNPIFLILPSLPLSLTLLYRTIIPFASLLSTIAATSHLPSFSYRPRTIERRSCCTSLFPSIGRIYHALPVVVVANRGS